MSRQATAVVVPRFFSRFSEEEKEIHYLLPFLNLHSASMLVCKLWTTKDTPCAPQPPSATLSNNNNRNVMTTVSKFGREVPKEIGATSQSGAHRTPRNKSQESTQDEIVSVQCMRGKGWLMAAVSKSSEGVLKTANMIKLQASKLLLPVIYTCLGWMHCWQRSLIRDTEGLWGTIT